MSAGCQIWICIEVEISNWELWQVGWNLICTKPIWHQTVWKKATLIICLAVLSSIPLIWPSTIQSGGQQDYVCLASRNGALRGQSHCVGELRRDVPSSFHATTRVWKEIWSPETLTLHIPRIRCVRIQLASPLNTDMLSLCPLLWFTRVMWRRQQSSERPDKSNT